MHFSGMCTARLLTVSQHALGRGRVCIRVCTGQGGVCLGVSARGNAQEGEQTPPFEQNDRQNIINAELLK